MRKSVLLSIFLLLAGATQAQYERNWALGLRVGEPVGINIRKYFPEGEKAFDVNVGTYGFLYGRERRYLKGDYRSAGLMIQGIYSWHHALFNREALHVYYGFGGQINQRNHFPDSRIGQRDDSEQKLSLGPAGAVGIEYKLPNNDIGVFLDAGGYVELLPAPFFTNLQISGGIRLNLLK